MADNRPANVQGPVLKWARERWGVTPEEAAAALEVDRAVIDAWEAGKARPTAEQAVQLSKAYVISFAELLRAEPPEEEHVPDFRVEPELPANRPYDLKRALLSAQDDQREASCIAEDLGRPVPPELPSVAPEADPAEAGAQIRRMLCGGSGDAVEPAAFADWRCRVEELGVLVFAYPMPRGRCSGAALWRDDQIPVIVVNAREAPEANTFALVHALGHVLNRRSAIYNLCDGADGDEEAWCSRFASAVIGRPCPARPKDEIDEAARVLRGYWTKLDERRVDRAYLAAEARRMGRGYMSMVLDGFTAGEIDEIDTYLVLGLFGGQVEGVAEELGLAHRLPAVLR